MQTGKCPCGQSAQTVRVGHFLDCGSSERTVHADCLYGFGLSTWMSTLSAKCPRGHFALTADSADFERKNSKFKKKLHLFLSFLHFSHLPHHLSSFNFFWGGDLLHQRALSLAALAAVAAVLTWLPAAPLLPLLLVVVVALL